MLVSDRSSPPLSLAYSEMATINELASSDVNNHVTLAILTPSQLDNIAPFVATRVIGSLRGIKMMDLFFPFRFFGWEGFTPPESQVMQPAHSLRHVRITSGSVGAMIALINRAPALEYLSLGFSSMPVETDITVTDRALFCLRRLSMWRSNTFSMPRCVPKILASGRGTLRSLSVTVDMIESLEFEGQSAGFHFANSLVHLALMTGDPIRSSSPGGSTHVRDDQTLQASRFIHTCPRLAHLSLAGFLAADLPRILAAVIRPLVSLAYRPSIEDDIVATSIFRPMFEEGHQAVSRLRVLAFSEYGIGPDCPVVGALCKRQRTVITFYGDLVSLMARRGTSKFRKLL